ncbi:hypothetical protein HRD65_10100 [Lactococcus lactis subsp. lactis]|uniref:hypothetical protein n=1 Tax=Lactococcus lactis TaxID=1358 RepID=UPI001C258026|nr:hypothetical protein [Lactococcus lactis]NRD17827.1 hypothetical protein [Lactococcus lactis subsp. lactis]
MTIVASNSLTLSNVNDGTITHYAYANSADGKDGFYVGGRTNLLFNSNFSSGLYHWTINPGTNKDCKAVVTTDSDGDTCIHITGTGVACGIYSAPAPFNQNQITTGSVLAKGTGRIMLVGLEGRPASNFGTVSTESYSKVGSTTQASSNTNCFVVYFSAVNDVVDVYIKFVKLEQGDKANPWSPAPSEAHPSYIGQYSDFNTTASTDPAKYAPWTIFKGNDGKDGRGIVSSEQKYQVTTTPAKPVDPWENSVWKTTQPTITATNKYLWSITRTTFNLAPLTQDIVEQKAVYGDKGTDGDPGKIVSDTEPSTRFKGLTWKYSGTADLTASDRTVIKPNTEYYYNGTHWIINLIEANQLNVNDLSAISGTFTNGKIENITKNGSVTSTILIEDKHILSTLTDTSQNTVNTLELDSQQGYSNTFADSNSGRTRTVQANFQGFFTSDTDGPSAQLTPYGVYVTNGLQTTTVSLGSGINATLAKIGQMCQISINSNSSNVPAGNGVALSGNIPAGWRPAIGTPFEVMMYSGTSFQRPLHITIGTDGKLSIVNVSASSYWCFGGTTYMLA